jgi:hypothetical protein
MQYHAREKRAGFLAVEGLDKEEEKGGGHGSGVQDSACCVSLKYRSILIIYNLQVVL